MPEEMKKEPAKPAGGSENNLLAAIGYIIAVLVPLFVIFTEKKNDKFLAFHAWQSLLFSVAVFVVFVVLGIITTVLGFIPGVNVVAGLLAACGIPILMLVMVLFALFLAYKAYQGEKYKIPMIGDFAEKQVK